MGDEEVERRWLALISSAEARDEVAIQRFLEQHPGLIPGARTLHTNSGHPPWPGGIISQPPLPDLSSRIPDFMWIASDSAGLYPICVEIETPFKRWYHARTLNQHSDLTTALDQIRHWKTWFAQQRNVAAFYDYYRLPRWARELTLQPQYIVVHGRRAEASRNRAAIEMRAQIDIPDTKVVTFDHLSHDPAGASWLTFRLDATGYRIIASPSRSPSNLWDRDAIDVIANFDEWFPGEDRSGHPSPGYRFTPPLRRPLN